MASAIVSLLACIFIGIIFIIAIKEKHPNWYVHAILFLVNLICLIDNLLHLSKGN